jgi:virginiamycin B lyase
MRRLALILALLPLAVPATAAATSAVQAPPVVGQVSEYELGAGTRPTALVAGPDGNLWFAGIRYVSGGFTDVLGKVTPQGQVSEFELGTHSANVGLGDIAVGPDGNLWFTEGGRTKVGRITTSGQITEFELPAGAGSATAIAAGADGNLWFTESGVGRIGRITPSGAVTEFPLGGAREFWGGGIAGGPDGALWVTLPGAGAIARIGIDGSEADFPLPEAAPAGYPNDIVVGPDGALWFGKSQAPIIGRINTAGLLTQLTRVRGPTISALAAGPFDDIWYSNGGGRIGWVVPGVAEGTTGCINSCTAPVTDLAEGPEGKLWFVAGVDGQSLYSTPGTIGTYAPPPLEVRIVGAGRVQGRKVQIPVSCRWTPAGRRCDGRLRLFGKLPGQDGGKQHRLAQAHLGLRLGTERRVALRLPARAAALLARGGHLPVRVQASVRGGHERSTRVELRAAR